MVRFTLKPLLLMLGLSLPCRVSATTSAAFVATSAKRHSRVVGSTHALQARYRRAGTDEDGSSTATTDGSDQQQRGRRSIFAAFSRKGRRQSKRVRMQTTDVTEQDTLVSPTPFGTPIPPPILFNGTMDTDWILGNFETSTPSSTGLDEITGNGKSPLEELSASAFASSATTPQVNVPRPVRPALLNAKARNDKNKASTASTGAFHPPSSRIRIGSNSTMALTLDSPPASLSSSGRVVLSPSKGALMTRMSRGWFQSVLEGLVHKFSKAPPVNLQVHASPTGNVLGNLLTRGQYRSNVALTFDKVRFQNICVSGGGRVDARRLVLNVWSFTPQMLRLGACRYPQQFDLVAKNCTLTQHDLLESSCIRNGLGRLLVRILKRAGVATTFFDVTITSIDVLPSNKISCVGEATTIFGSRVQFEVRSGIGTSCRGHVLTFPGLEVSLHPASRVFMPVVPDVNLDIGHNARFLKVAINGQTREVSLDAHVSITPSHTIKMNQKYIQSNKAYLAQFFFDVGQWITDVGNFTK